MIHSSVSQDLDAHFRHAARGDEAEHDDARVNRSRLDGSIRQDFGECCVPRCSGLDLFHQHVDVVERGTIADRSVVDHVADGFRIC